MTLDPWSTSFPPATPLFQRGGERNTLGAEWNPEGRAPASTSPPLPCQSRRSYRNRARHPPPTPPTLEPWRTTHPLPQPRAEADHRASAVMRPAVKDSLGPLLSTPRRRQLKAKKGRTMGRQKLEPRPSAPPLPRNREPVTSCMNRLKTPDP